MKRTNRLLFVGVSIFVVCLAVYLSQRRHRIEHTGSEILSESAGKTRKIAEDQIEELLQENSRLREQAGSRPGAVSDELADKVLRLKELLAALPEQQIPELQYATEADWFAAVDGQLNSVADYRRAMSAIRAAAQRRFSALMQPALKDFLAAHEGNFPSDVGQLADYFRAHIDPAILKGYKIVPSKDVPYVKVGGDWAITQSTTIDTEYDSHVVIGPNGNGWFSALSQEPAAIEARRNQAIVEPVLQAFAAANGRKSPTSINELFPYVTTPEQQEALEKLKRQADQRKGKR